MSVKINEDICLKCKATSNSDGTVIDFHEIYDELGIELQLNKLVEKYYNIKTDETQRQKLCIVCVNNLIELFDIDEYEKAVTANNCANDTDNSVIIDNDQIDSDNDIDCDYILSTPVHESELKPHSENNYIIHYPSNDSVPFAEMHIDELTDTEHFTDIQIVLEEAENPDIPTVHQIETDNETEVESLLTNDNQTSCHNEDSSSIHIVFDKSTNGYQFINSNENNANQEEINMNTYDVSEIDNEVFENMCVEALEDEDDTNISDDCLESENINTHDFDYVDINDYLDMVITTKFEDLELKWCTQCKICSLKFETFAALLTHDCLNDLTAEQCRRLPCVIADCNEEFTNKSYLARHIILKHHPQLDKLKIYGSCPECTWRFSNFLLYNKHSCCRHLKRKPGRRNTCKSCKLDFLSLKRFAFHMQYHMAKYRPKICFICEEGFSNSNDLFEHVHYDHEDENAMACIKCDRFFKNEVSFRRHLRTHESTNIFECAYCDRNFEERHDLMNHLEIYHDFRAKQIKCVDCDKSFMSNVSYRNHIKFHSPEAEVYGYVCDECGLVAAEGEYLKKHAERDVTSACREGTIHEEILSVVYTCENCYMDFKSVAQLKQHRLSSLHNDQEFSCLFCMKCFASYKQMRNHMKAHKEYDKWLQNFPICRLYLCNIGNCEETYPLWTSLYYHKKRPHNKAVHDDDFKCQFCRKQCTSKMSLAVHVARSHNNDNIKCSKCKNSYKDEKSLQEHVKYMHTPIECKKCFKIIKNQRNYETHELIVHQNKQRYFCRYCDRGFYHKSEMECHQKNIHSKVIFQCELCEFRTVYRKSLDIHVAKHNNQMNFLCNFCSKSFTRKHVLNCHIRRHHKKREFICCERLENGCNAAFISFGELCRHAEKKHNYKFEGVHKRKYFQRIPHHQLSNSKLNNRKRKLNRKTSNRKRQKLAIEDEEDAVQIDIQQVNGNEAAGGDNDNVFELNADDLIDDKANDYDNQQQSNTDDYDNSIDMDFEGNLQEEDEAFTAGDGKIETKDVNNDNVDTDLDGDLQEEDDMFATGDYNAQAKKLNDNNSIVHEPFDSIELILQEMEFENGNDSNITSTSKQYLD